MATLTMGAGLRNRTFPSGCEWLRNQDAAITPLPALSDVAGFAPAGPFRIRTDHRDYLRGPYPSDASRRWVALVKWRSPAEPADRYAPHAGQE